jgi:hypothetical protein
MKRIVFCLLALGAWACGPADEMQLPEIQETSQEAAVETAPQMLNGGGFQTLGFYEWANRSSSACGSWQYFPVNVPENTPNLKVYSQYGSVTLYPYYGAQLYVRWGSKPTTSSYYAASLSYGTNEETVSINSPPPGTWWIGLYAYCGYSGVTVGAIY